MALTIARESAALTSTMADLHSLVHVQEEAVQVVEAKVDSALVRTDAGIRELEIATTYVATYRKKCVLVWFLIALIIAVPLSLHFAVPAGSTGHI